MRYLAIAASIACLATPIFGPSTALAGDTVPPTVPGSFQAKAQSSGDVTMSWNPSTDNVGVARYDLYRNGVKFASTTTRGYVERNLPQAVPLSLTVQAVDTSGKHSASSNAVSIVIPDVLPPAAPQNFTASITVYGKVALKWSAAKDNVKTAGYKIYRNGILLATTTSTKYTVEYPKGVSTVSDTFVVLAFDAAGNVSKPSPMRTVTNLDVVAPTAPSTLSSTAATSNSSVLSWSASKDFFGVTRYSVFRNDEPMPVVTTTGLSAKVTNLAKGYTTRFHVKAYDGAWNASLASPETTVANRMFPNVGMANSYLYNDVNLWMLTSPDVTPPFPFPGVSNDFQDLHVRWSRFHLDWPQVERDHKCDPATPEVCYDWARVDAAVDALRTRDSRYPTAPDIQIVLNAGHTPEWARPAGTKPLSPPSNMQDYADFMTAAARHFGNRVTAYELWNEPNNFPYWAVPQDNPCAYPEYCAGNPNGGPDPIHYFDLVRAGYNAIHAQNAADGIDRTVIAGAVAGRGSAARIESGSILATKFVQKMYDHTDEFGKTFKDYTDAVSWHAYTYPYYPNDLACENPWQRIIPPSEQMQGCIDPDTGVQQLSARGIMEAHGDADKKLWATEFGAPSDAEDKYPIDDPRHDPNGGGATVPLKCVVGVDFPCTKVYFTPFLQCENYRQGIENWSSYDWAGPITWFTYRDDDPNEDGHHNNGLWTYSDPEYKDKDGVSKPIYPTKKTFWNRYQSLAKDGFLYAETDFCTDLKTSKDTYPINFQH